MPKKPKLTKKEIKALKDAVRDKLTGAVEWLDNEAYAFGTKQKIHKDGDFLSHFEMADCNACDAADLAQVAVLILNGEWRKAAKKARNMDTEPREHIPDSVYEKLMLFY